MQIFVFCKIGVSYRSLRFVRCSQLYIFTFGLQICKREMGSTLCSYSYMFPQLYSPTAVCSHSCIAPQLYVPQLYSPQLYVPTAV